MNQFVTAEEAINPKVKHSKGHKRLGPGYTTCGKKVGSKKATKYMSDCEQCAAQSADDTYKVREDDLLRKNYAAMRDAKIRCEEALLQKETEILYLKEQNMALGQERGKWEKVDEGLSGIRIELERARNHPFLYWLKSRFEK